jgi:hypothetical protein
MGEGKVAGKRLRTGQEVLNITPAEILRLSRLSFLSFANPLKPASQEIIKPPPRRRLVLALVFLKPIERLGQHRSDLLEWCRIGQAVVVEDVAFRDEVEREAEGLESCIDEKDRLGGREEGDGKGEVGGSEGEGEVEDGERGEEAEGREEGDYEGSGEEVVADHNECE